MRHGRGTRIAAARTGKASLSGVGISRVCSISGTDLGICIFDLVRMTQFPLFLCVSQARAMSQLTVRIIVKMPGYGGDRLDLINFIDPIGKLLCIW